MTEPMPSLERPRRVFKSRDGTLYDEHPDSRTWTRRRSAPEQIEKILRAEFARCGWSPKTVKVRALGENAFVLNLGALRGLDPSIVYRALRDNKLNAKGQLVPAFPDKCGARRILEALSRLPLHAPNDTRLATDSHG